MRLISAPIAEICMPISESRDLEPAKITARGAGGGTRETRVTERQETWVRYRPISVALIEEEFAMRTKRRVIGDSYMPDDKARMKFIMGLRSVSELMHIINVNLQSVTYNKLKIVWNPTCDLLSCQNCSLTKSICVICDSINSLNIIKFYYIYNTSERMKIVVDLESIQQ